MKDNKVTRRKRTHGMAVRSRLGRDQKGLSSIITVAGIIAVLVGLVVGPILTVYIPNKMKEAEVEHMDNVSDSFSYLRGNINKMIDQDNLNGRSNMRLELGTDLNNIMLPDSTGTVYLRQGTPEIGVYNADNGLDLYAKSFGSIEYKSKNSQYSDQRYIYEGGGVIVEQGGSSTMDLLPGIDIRKGSEGKILLSDNRIRGNFPGYDTQNPNAVYYNFSQTPGDVSMTYDIYNNNNNLFETDFDTTAESMPFTERQNDWFIESELDRTNIIGKWTFSEVQDDAYEESNGDLNTFIGDFKNNATHAPGKFGSGVELSSASKGYITVPSAGLAFTGTHTIECWIFPYSVSSSRYIISKLSESQFQGYSMMLVNGELKYMLGDGTALQNLQTSGANIKAYKWTHVAASWDGSNMRIYVDGDEAASRAYSGSLTSNVFKLVFGSNQAENGNYFNGKIDEVILTSGAKSSFDRTEGIFSVRGDTPGKGYDCLATLDYMDKWVEQGNNNDWQYRKKLTISSSMVEDDLINFPVLVSMTDPDLKSKARSDGYDIVFTSDDGVTRLAHEIESYNSATGMITAWVLVPEVLASIDTDIYMYYGNSAITTPSEDPGGVWDDDFKGVWHLSEEQSGTGNTGLYKDSTQNANDGDDEIAATGQEGQINGGQQFSGAGDHIEVAHDADLNIQGPMTISFWIKPTQNTGTFNRIVEKGLWGYQTSYYFGCGNGQNDLTFYLSNNAVFDTANNVLTVDSWQHAAVSYNSSGGAILLLNGVEIDSGSYTGAITGNTDTLHISFSDSTFDFPGYIDEVRISDTARTSDWIKTGYNNQNNPGSFISISGEDNIYQVAIFDITGPDSPSNIYYKKKITLKASEVSQDLTDFPVLISLTDNDLKTKARSDGYDVYFTESDGETRLDHEVETYQSVTGTLNAWVRIPSLSSTVDTVIWMHYGNPSASDQSNPEDVWTNNYRGVWHLKENPGDTAPQMLDSTSNDNDASSMGSMSSSNQITGKINGGVNFDGIDDKLNVPTDTSHHISGDATVSGWFKLPSAHTSTSRSRILAEKHISNDYDFTIVLAGIDYVYSGITRGSLVMKTENQNVDGGVRYKYTSQTSWNANTWYHFVGVINTTNNDLNAIFINSNNMATSNVGGSTDADLNFNADFQFGGGNVDTANIPTGVNHSDAAIDEYRISKGSRSSGWIATEYSNQNNPGNFYTVGAEELHYVNLSSVVVEVKALANDYSGNYANAFVVFDYQSDTDFKYAGMRVLNDEWVIGHRTSSGYDQKAVLSETIDTNTWYDLKMVLYEDSVSLYADGDFKINYTFSDVSWGKFGLANERAHSHFDDLKIYYNVLNGVQIFINNQYLGNAMSTARNGWDGPYDKFIPASYLNSDNDNVIKFKNVFSSSKIWALRNVFVKSNPRGISMSMITVACDDKSVGGSDSHVVTAKLVRQEINEYEFDRTNVTIEITSRYFDAWWNFFNNKLNETGTNLVWDPDKLETDYYLWWEGAGDDLRTIYVTLRGIELLSCGIAVVEVSID